MTQRNDQTIDATSKATTGCDCEACRTGDLAVNPFVALRVAYGMLLGEEDFRTLMGNPRGKQMMHSAWLHGTGVVWGYDVASAGLWTLEVSPGLAIDGVGRELLNESTGCVDIRELVDAAHDGSEKNDQNCATRTLTACLVAEFDSCLSAPVPTLADPCDVTRKHDDYSRVIERVRLSLRTGCCPCPMRPYHRVRVLLGLDEVGEVDEPGDVALQARRVVSAAPADERPHALLCEFRRLAALDSIDLHPAREPGDCFPTLFPIAEEDSAVVLACIEIDVRDRDGCPEILDVRIDREVRSTLLPTATIQELTCGLAPGLLGEESSGDGGGPRVIGERIELAAKGRRLTIPVTAPLSKGSVMAGSVGITSLTADKAGGWVVEDIYDTRYDDAQTAIVVDLADRPINNVIRVVVRGTGPKPVMGAAPAVPLAGLVGGPPGTRHNGHDAIWMFDNTVHDRDRGTDTDTDGNSTVADADAAEQHTTVDTKETDNER